MELLKLLQGKNKYLRKFLHYTEQFAPLAEANDFSTLTQFHGRRDSILKALLFFDKKISEILVTLPKSSKTPSLTEAVGKLIETKTQLIHAIIIADQRIMIALENEKNRLQKKL